MADAAAIKEGAAATKLENGAQRVEEGAAELKDGAQRLVVLPDMTTDTSMTTEPIIPFGEPWNFKRHKMLF